MDTFILQKICGNIIKIQLEVINLKHTYTPKGVCSRKMVVDIQDGKIADVQIIGGCNGNLQGIASLVIGMDAVEVVDKLEGIDCGGRGTSCPDQLAMAINEALQME